MSTGFAVDSEWLREVSRAVDSAAGLVGDGDVESADRVGDGVMGSAIVLFAERWTRGIRGAKADLGEFARRLVRSADLYDAGDRSALDIVTDGAAGLGDTAGVGGAGSFAGVGGSD